MTGESRVSGKRFVFAGNRFFVLEEMLAKGLDLVRILAVENSFLQRVLTEKGIGFTVIESKQHLVSVLAETAFDIFLANGCPFILPISRLSDGTKTFLNVHPSPLPDLRGADPVPGSLLHGRDSGATCHVMDDGVDTGPIIARVTIPNTPDLDCGLLYQMSFMAEKEVFHLALEAGFQVTQENRSSDDCIYFTNSPEALDIDLGQTTGRIIARIKAFCTRSQGARLHEGDLTLRILDVEEVTNPYLLKKIDDYRENEVVFNYESALVIRHAQSFLKLKAIEGDLSRIATGQVLTGKGDPVT